MTLDVFSSSFRNLVDADVFSKSDPMCVAYTKQTGLNEWYEIGRTETISNTLNPDFTKKFVLNYYFEESQKIKFEIYDIDSTSRRLEDHDFLGVAECTLGEIVSNGCLKRQLKRLIIRHFPFVLHLSRLGHPPSSKIQLHNLQFQLVTQAHTDMELLPDNPTCIDNGILYFSAVVAEELSNCKDEVSLHFTGVKLDKKDFFGKSDPFLVISKVNENNELVS
ncbi:Copine-5 [Nymphon striatum]|nr:Copine-5 [Nymphon striatum]